jgi:hypothetical protein
MLSVAVVEPAATTVLAPVVSVALAKLAFTPVGSWAWFTERVTASVKLALRLTVRVTVPE